MFKPYSSNCITRKLWWYDTIQRLPKTNRVLTDIWALITNTEYFFPIILDIMTHYSKYCNFLCTQ